MTPKSHLRIIPGTDPARNAMEELEADRTAGLTRMHPEEVGIESVDQSFEPRPLRDVPSTEGEEDFAANDRDEWGIDVILDDWLADDEAPAGVATPVEYRKRAKTETEDTQTDTSDDGSERW